MLAQAKQREAEKNAEETGGASCTAAEVDNAYREQEGEEGQEATKHTKQQCKLDGIKGIKKAKPIKEEEKVLKEHTKARKEGRRREAKRFKRLCLRDSSFSAAKREKEKKKK